MFVEQQFRKFYSQNGCTRPKEVHINLPQWLRLAKSQQCWLKHHQVHKEWVHQPTFTAEWLGIYKCKSVWHFVKQNMYNCTLINLKTVFTYFNLLIIRKINRSVLSFISNMPIGLTHYNWRQLVANKTCFHFQKRYFFWSTSIQYIQFWKRVCKNHICCGQNSAAGFYFPFETAGHLWWLTKINVKMSLSSFREFLSC